MKLFRWGVTVVAATGLSARLISMGASVSLDGINFFISPFSEGKVYNASTKEIAETQTDSLGFIPATIVTGGEDCADLHALFANWTALDDVWQPSFLKTVFIHDNTRDLALTGAPLFAGVETRMLPLPPEGSREAKRPLRSGPYFVNAISGEAHRAYRLYDDEENAFSQSLLQTPGGVFQTLSAQVEAAASLTIGVPSRLYFERTTARPLDGVRVGVKDMYALAGTRSSHGSRAWFGLYGRSRSTATVVQRLVDAGAVVVGLQKLSQFANGETPTADWVDYLAPFNPRGDGYQNPSSSSAGGGASVAAYSWLDVALGSDTGGSVRGPAAVQGLFGNRPSHGLVSLDGVMPLAPEFDTPGLLARDPGVWDAAAAAIYGSTYSNFDNSTKYTTSLSAYPTRVIALDFPSANNTSPNARMQAGFAAGLAAHLNATLTQVTLEELWTRSRPAEALGQSLQQLLNLTYTALVTKRQTKLLRDPFYKDYEAAHDGRRPFVDPVSLARWAWADSQHDSIIESATVNKTLFMDWFNSVVLPPVSDSSSAACSSAILLHTDNTGFFSTRNEYREPPLLPFGFTNGEISVLSGAPDSVFPLGQVVKPSIITGRDEPLPVAVDVMVARGCDGLIGRLARDLVATGLLKVPKTGSGLMGGEILLRRTLEVI